MERSSIDLNQHAFDLNELPLTDLTSSFPDPSSPNRLEKPWLPKKGGWLELFCKMFGHESLVMNDPTSMMYNSNSLRIEPDSHRQDGNPNGKVSVLRTGSMPRNLQRLQNFSDFHHDHKQKGNFIVKNNVLHNNSMVFKGQNLDNEPKFHRNQGKRKANRTKSDGKQGFSHSIEVPSIINLPCLPMIERVNPDLQASNNTTHNRSVFDLFPQGDKSYLMNSHKKLFPINPEQRSTSLDSTEDPLKDCLKHRLPTWDLNNCPSPVINVDFQSFLQVSPQSSSIRKQSKLSSVNLDRTPPIPVIKNKQKCSGALLLSNTFEMIPCSQEKQCGMETDLHSVSTPMEAYGIPKKINELSVKNDHRYATEGSKLFDIEPHEDMQLSSTTTDRIRGQDPRIKIITSPDWLPEGWITELKRRQGGSTAGTTDKYYKDPITGHRFRSKNEVINYLQTGVSSRNKSLSKPFERSSPINATTSVLLKEQSSNDFQPLAADHSFSSLGTDVAPIDLNRQCMSSKDLVSEKFSITDEEQDDIIEGSCEQKFTRNPTSNVWRIGRCDPSSKESLVSSCKRKMHHDSYVFASSSKRQCSIEQEEQEDQGGGEENLKQVSSVPLLVQERGATMSHRVDDVNTRISNSSCGELPVSVEAKLYHDRQISQPLSVSWKVNERHLSPLCTNQISDTIECNSNGHIGTAHHQKELVNTIYEKKTPRLTLKQERELFVSLGRKLCQEFISSANGALEQHVNSKP